MTLTAEQKRTAKPLPPFIRELRDKVRAGTKTETRRVMKPQPSNKIPAGHERWMLWGNQLSLADGRDEELESQEEWTARYAVGDICYLREPLVPGPRGYVCYADDGKFASVNLVRQSWKWRVRKLSHIYMPRRFARTFCMIAGVRTERLQVITDPEARAEGCCGVASTKWGTPNFRYLWDSINGKRYPWASNPWVWVYRFKLL